MKQVDPNMATGDERTAGHDPIGPASRSEPSAELGGTADAIEALTRIYVARVEASMASWQATIDAQGARTSSPDDRDQEPEERLRVLQADLLDLERYQREHQSVADMETRQALDWERRALMAYGDGRADLGEQAERRQGEHAAAAADARHEVSELRTTVEWFRRAIAELRARIESSPPRRP